MRIDEKKLKIAMARACMNRNDLAKASGVALGTLCGISAKGGKAAVITVGKLAKALGCDVTEILADEEL